MKIVVKHEMPLSEKKKNIYIYIYIKGMIYKSVSKTNLVFEHFNNQ